MKANVIKMCAYLWICPALSLSACTTTKRLGDTLLNWVETDTTTRADVIAKWGEPAYTLSHGRILFYRASYLPNEALSSFFNTVYELKLVGDFPIRMCNESFVLISDNQGVIRYHGQVTVNDEVRK